MNLMLLGAGASYGSSSHGAPPIGAGLFAELRRFNPAGWGALPAEIRSHFEADFERGMRELARTRSHDMPILQRAMAAYFFSFLPTQDSLYVRLAERVRRNDWKGAIATLNYERLLEVSLLHVGVQPVVNTLPSIGQTEVCFPHGCCHLFCEGVQASATDVSFSGSGVAFDGQVVAISDPTEFQARINGNSVPPVMSYFEPQKTTSSGVSFIRDQRARWAALAEDANTIAIVGVKVRPSDSHLWEAIAKTKARVVFCSGNTAGIEFQEWAEKARPGKESEVLRGYFADEFNTLCGAVGLW